MVAPTPSLRDLPDLITYLKLVKAQLSSEPETLQQVLDNVEQWIRNPRCVLTFVYRDSYN